MVKKNVFVAAASVAVVSLASPVLLVNAADGKDQGSFLDSALDGALSFSKAQKKKSVTNELQEFLGKIFGKKGPADKCKEKKAKGELPNLMAGDSPLKSVGYMKYDQDSNTSQIHPGVVFSLGNGIPTPMRIEAHDFVLQGRADEMVAFLECFGDYPIIAKDIDMDTGKWVEGHGNICIQLQNIDETMKNMSESAAEVAARYMLKKIVAKLRVVGVIDAHLMGLASQASDKIPEYLQLVFQIKDYAKKVQVVYPILAASMERIAEDLGNEEMTWKDRVKSLKDFLTAAQSKDFVKENWAGFEDVDVTKRMIGHITIHPRPLQGNKALYCTGKSKIDADELLEAFKNFTKKSNLDKLAAALPRKL